MIRSSHGFPSILVLSLLGGVACGSDGDDGSNETGGSAAGGSAGIVVGSGGGKSGTGGLGGRGGSSGGGGTTITGGAAGAGPNTGGAMPMGGSAGTGAATSTGGSSTGGGTSTGGAPSTQPLGSICANDGNCSQSQGSAVCCQNTCTLEADCPGGTVFIACDSGDDCQRYSGGWLCCRAGSGNQVMQYCTKQNGCLGTEVP